ncbi:MAG: hypothetical protein GY937_24965 [bacterium]|nr:hypothetical protein [bacterium]
MTTEASPVLPTIETSDATGLATPRALSDGARVFFMQWTAAWWGSVGVLGALFFTGLLDFTTSAKLSLYGISIWLNGCALVLWAGRRAGRPRLSVHHDALVVWMLSYAMTNILWEIPWVVFSPFVFSNLTTLEDVVAQTPYMRESLANMYWWILASFGSVDLRTVNHDPTFYTVELFAFVNVAGTLTFFHLNKKRSPYRYLIPVLGCGEPIAATVIFSFAEVFGAFENMAGGIADTLLALLWTQYQYILFPLIFGMIGFRLLREDLRSIPVAPET